MLPYPPHPPHVPTTGPHHRHQKSETTPNSASPRCTCDFPPPCCSTWSDWLRTYRTKAGILLATVGQKWMFAVTDGKKTPLTPRLSAPESRGGSVGSGRWGALAPWTSRACGCPPCRTWWRRLAELRGLEREEAHEQAEAGTGASNGWCDLSRCHRPALRCRETRVGHGVSSAAAPSQSSTSAPRTGCSTSAYWTFRSAKTRAKPRVS
jgi:hypothetical protein